MLAMNSETAYKLPSESLRDVIYQLQQGDAFVTEMHYKSILQRKTAAGSADKADWMIDGRTY